MHRFPTLLVLFTLLVTQGSQAQTDRDILLAVTAPTGGRLAADYDFETVEPVFRNVCGGGQCLFSNTNPGFGVLTSASPSRGLYPPPAGVAPRLELVAIDTGASVKVGSSVLRTPGQSVSLGVTPEIHIHPSWQVTAGELDAKTYAISFRLVDGSSSFAESDLYTIRLSTAPRSATETPTASPTSSHSSPPVATNTPTPTASAPVGTPTRPVACPGDCNDDGEVTVDELVRSVNIALGTRTVDDCRTVDVGGDGEVTVDELVRSVNAALGGC